MLKRKKQRIKNIDKNTKNDKIHLSIVSIFGSIIILSGIVLVLYNYILTKKVMAYDYMANVFYSDLEKGEEPKQGEENNNDNNQQNDPSDISKSNNHLSFQYIGYLEIPKINFKKGFVDKDSKDNDVEKNLFIASNSSYPDVDRGNFIIAAHSGTGWKAFFNNLYKLSVGDQAIVTYNNRKYTYNIVNIYKQNKTGQIAIYRNYEKTTLTLVTCTNNDDKTQTIYIAELTNVS